jgi:hypothetical protein
VFFGGAVVEEGETSVDGGLSDWLPGRVGPLPIPGLWTVSCDTPAGTVTPTGAAVGWHTDGARRRLGAIRTSLVACLRPAPVGGSSLLFNATAAFVELARSDPAATAALMAPDVLAHTATVAGGGHPSGQLAVRPSWCWHG